MEVDILKKKNGDKYLIFDSADENKEILKKYPDVWNGIKNKIKEVNGSKCDHEEDYMKIKFSSDDNLPLNKPLKFHIVTIIISCVFSEGGTFYPQLLLDDTLYELNVLNFFFLIFFLLLYIKMGENTDLTYYQKNKDLILNKAKDCCKHNKERLREQERDKNKSLSEEEKNKKREYGKNGYRKMSEEKKQRLKEYQKTY